MWEHFKKELIIDPKNPNGPKISKTRCNYYKDFSQSPAVASTIFFDMQKSVVEKWGKLNFLKVVAPVHLILFSMIMLKIE